MSEARRGFCKSRYKLSGVDVYRGTKLLSERKVVPLRELSKWAPVQCRGTNKVEGRNLSPLKDMIGADARVTA